MATAAVLSAAASAIPIPGAGAVVSAINSGIGKTIITALDPGKARDAARINRRDFFLNAAKAGSVTAARYLINGPAQAYTVKEKNEFNDGIKELEQGPTPWRETLAAARNAGPKWDDATGSGDLLPVGNVIAAELGKTLNVPANVQDLNAKGAIESWASQFGYTIRKDASQAIAGAAAGVGSSLASAVAPPGSAQASTQLIPTNKNMLIVGGLVVAAILFLALRKH